MISNIAAVLPRYGASLGGGAETLIRSLLLDLQSDGKQMFGFLERIEVWTTCAKDHRTWENFYAPGITVEDGITVRRFLVDNRDIGTFLNAERKMAAGLDLAIDEQLDWMSSSINSSALYAHIAQCSSQFDAILFGPYLFATSFWGPLIDPQRSILVPCLHNERYAYQPIFKHVFNSVRGILFNALPEQELATAIYSIEDLHQRAAVVGMSFSEEDITYSHEYTHPRPYMLYSGRKEQGKNLDLLIQYFSEVRESLSQEIDLVIIGSGDINFIETLPDGVVDLGFVSEETKEALMRSALVLCQPSINESFSIVIMESWLRETPVIVHELCAVTRHHVTTAGGGLFFSSAAEFKAVLEYLLSNPELRTLMGKSGKRYVHSTYSKSAVIGRLHDAFVKFGLSRDKSSGLSELGD